MSSGPVTAVEPRGTRAAYVPRTRVSSAGGSWAAQPQNRASSAFHDGMHSWTHWRSEPLAGR